MPSCTVHVKLNPPGHFVDHAAAVADTFKGLIRSVEDVRVVYSHGPAAQVTFTVPALDKSTNADLVALAEKLRTQPETRAEFLLVEVWLTPEERDAAQGGTMEAYDAVYRHD